MQNCQDNFKRRKRSFISAFLICLTVLWPIAANQIKIKIKKKNKKIKKKKNENKKPKK